jgi:hypothetical protein
LQHEISNPRIAGWNMVCCGAMRALVLVQVLGLAVSRDAHVDTVGEWSAGALSLEGDTQSSLVRSQTNIVNIVNNCGHLRCEQEAVR